MASPAIRSSTSGNSGGNSTSTTITYPATIEAGDVLVMFVGGDGNLNCSASGWTFVQVQDSGSGMSCVYGLRDTVAAGTEDGTTFSLSTNNESFGWTIYAISGCEFANILSPQTVGGSSTGNPDPPSISPDASRDWLFMAAGGWDGNRSLSSYPTNYTATNSQQTNRVAASTGGGVASAGRQLTTGSAENPGVFTISSADEWAAITVAFPPAIPKTNANAPTATASGAALAPTARYWVRANAGLAAAVGVAYGGGGGTGSVQKSWPWATTNEGFAHTGTGHGAYHSGEGNPAGSIYIYVDYGTLWYDDWFTLSGVTWEALGVPSGSTVTRARLNTGQHFWSGVQGECGFDIALQDGSGTHLAYILQDTPGANDATWATYLTQQWMDFGDQSSSSGMRVVLHAYANTGAGGDGTLVGNFDNLAIDIEYVSSGGTVQIATFSPLAQAQGAALVATAEIIQGVTETKVYPATATATGSALAPARPEVTVFAPTGQATGAAIQPSVVSGKFADAPLASGTGAALAASVAKFENVRANAGLAAASGSALASGARPEKLVGAGLATAAGSALTGSAAHFENVRANAGLATASGSALGAPASEGAIAPAAGAQGSALAPLVSISVLASSATATGEGLTATVQTTGAEPIWHPWSATWSNTVGAGTSAPAGLAVAQGSALAASVQEEVGAGIAQAAGSALAPTAIPERRVSAPIATASGQALAAIVSEEAIAGLATASGSAQDATVSTSGFTNAPAEQAQAAGSALEASVSKFENLRVNAPLATATGLGLVGIAVPERRIVAGLASATGAALAGKVSLGAISSSATATGAALDAVVQTQGQTSAPAALASATGAALVASVQLLLWAGAPTAGATGTALDPRAGLSVFAPTATAIGSALAPAALKAIYAQAPLATAVGQARSSLPWIAAMAPRATAQGEAYPAAPPHPAVWLSSSPGRPIPPAPAMTSAGGAGAPPGGSMEPTMGPGPEAVES